VRHSPHRGPGQASRHGRQQARVLPLTGTRTRRACPPQVGRRRDVGVRRIGGGAHSGDVHARQRCLDRGGLGRHRNPGDAPPGFVRHRLERARLPVWGERPTQHPALEGHPDQRPDASQRWGPAPQSRPPARPRLPCARSATGSRGWAPGGPLRGCRRVPPLLGQVGRLFGDASRFRAPAGTATTVIDSIVVGLCRIPRGSRGSGASASAPVRPRPAASSILTLRDRRDRREGRLHRRGELAVRDGDSRVLRNCHVDGLRSVGNEA
jgi:hypothetical protein